DVRIQITENSLGIDQVFRNIRLQDESRSDTRYQNSYNVRVSQDTQPGLYPIQFGVFFRDRDSNDAFMTETLFLRVENCQEEETQETETTHEENESIVVVPAPEQPTTQQPSSGTAVPISVVQPRSNALLITLIISLIVLLLVVVSLVVVLLKKK
ncbi:MAG: hypothetical protein ACMXYA_03550, partial [Candidatus Woesearchaeota archaeon]